jgi:hypothetical protein
MEATRGLFVKAQQLSWNPSTCSFFMKRGEPWLNLPYFVAILFILLLGFFV